MPHKTAENANLAYQILHKRGIANSAQQALWQPYGAGWRYPLIDEHGQPTTIYRWKAYDSNAKPKYRWLPNKPAGYDYYFPAAVAIQEAVTRADGRLYIANGEPSLLAFRAAGVDNVVCWFGEGSIPKTFAQDCQRWGVRHVIYYPDRDNTGEQSAQKLARRLLNTPIAYSAYELPPIVGEKGDINDLWQQTKFERELFYAILKIAPIILHQAANTPAPAPKRRRQLPAPDDNDERRHNLIADVEMALGVSGMAVNDKGFVRKPIACVARNHEHDDRRPAAYWNSEGHFLHCHKCGQSYGLNTVADLLGIDRQQYRPQKRNRRQQQSQPRPQTRAKHQRVNYRYISELPTATLHQCRATILRSPIGTGKTELAKRLATGKKRVLVISHRIALSKSLSNRLDFHNYLEAPQDDDLLRMHHLVIVANSLHKLIPRRAGVPLPQYDMVIIDECEQVLGHLTGNTFERDEAITAHNVLRALVRNAGQVLALDAHAGRLTWDFLTEVLGEANVQFIDNQHKLERGTLKLWQHPNNMIAHADALIAQDAGAVVFAISGRKHARTLARRYQERLGEDAVMFICGDNSKSYEVQRFINNINQQLPQKRVLIYTPSLGTGIDIQAPVRAIFGIFHQEPLDAHDCHQMLGRCRNAQERHAYVSAVEGNRETDAEVIYNRYYTNALKTARRCSFDAFGNQQLADDHKALLKLVARVQARRNRSLNNLLGHFMALARRDGFSLQLPQDEGHNQRVYEQMKDAREALQKEERALVLSVKPVSPEEFDAANGELQAKPEMRAGLKRWWIEETYGQTINDELYDHYNDGRGRTQLLQFCDLFITPTRLQSQDRHQAESNIPLHKRGHYSVKQAILTDLIRTVFGKLSAEVLLTEEELNARMGEFLARHEDDLRRYFNRRTDNSDTPKYVLRWLLRRLGLNLKTYRSRRGDVYGIDADLLVQMLAYRDSRLEQLVERDSLDEADIIRDALDVSNPNDAAGRAKTCDKSDTYCPDFCTPDEKTPSAPAGQCGENGAKPVNKVRLGRDGRLLSAFS